MSLRLSLPGERQIRLHTCSVCGARGTWSDQWSWYGSWRNYDERPEWLILACSPTCKTDAQTRGMIR